MAFLNSVSDDVNTKLDWMGLIERDARDDPWPLILALPQIKDEASLELVSTALSRFDPAKLEFFTPQLCQIAIDKGEQRARPLARTLLQLSRRSTRFALRIYFIFQAAASDGYSPETTHWCQQLLADTQVCLTSSDLNPEFESLLALYVDHQNDMDVAQGLVSPRGAQSSNNLMSLPARRTTNVSRADSLYNSRDSIIVQPLPTSSPPTTSPIAELLSEEHKNLIAKTVQAICHGPEGISKPPAPAPSPFPPIQAPSSSYTPRASNGVPSATSKPRLSNSNPSIPTVASVTAAIEIPSRNPQMHSSAPTPMNTPASSTSTSISSNSTTPQSSLPNSPNPHAKSPLFENPPSNALPTISSAASSPIGSTSNITDSMVVDEGFFMVDSDEQGKPPKKFYQPAVYIPKMPDENLDRLGNLSNEVVALTHSNKIQKKSLTRVYQMYMAFKADKVALTSPLPPPEELENYADPEPDFILREQARSRHLRQRYISAQLRLIRGLTDISSVLISMHLKEKELKNAALRHSLKLLNSDKDFIKGIYTTILSPDGHPVRLLRIPYTEALALNSRDRVPYLLNVEVSVGFDSGLAKAVSSGHAKENSLTITDAVKHPLSESFDFEEGMSSEEHSGSFSATTISLNSKASADDDTKTHLKPLVPLGGNEGLRDEAEKNVKVTKLSNFQIMDEWRVSNNVTAPLSSEKSVLDKAFGLNWPARKEKLRQSSPVGNAKGWDLISVIVKAGDDLRQEQLAMQIIQSIHDVFVSENLPLVLHPYMVLATSADSGLIETVHDAASIDGLKKALGVAALKEYFLKAYGPPDGAVYKKCVMNFVESLSAYSLVCYLLQIKDRHNGNIMMKRDGYVIHIDYGFILNTSPGNLQFEKAPFKLPMEFVDVMGGSKSDMFEYFKTLLRSGFIAVRRHYQKIMFLVDSMRNAGNGKLACYKNADLALGLLRERFQLSLSEEDMISFTDQLTEQSMGNWSTDAYDRFQYFSNGIL